MPGLFILDGSTAAKMMKSNFTAPENLTAPLS